MESKIKNGRTGIHSDSKDIQKQKNFGEKITIYVVFKEDHHTTNLSLLNYDLLIRTIVKRSSIICQLKIVGHDKTRTFLLLRKHFMYMQVHCSTQLYWKYEFLWISNPYEDKYTVLCAVQIRIKKYIM